MTFPENFEQKIGFTEIRTFLKGHCMSTLGTDWVEHKLQFFCDLETIRHNLTLAKEFERFDEEEEDVYEEFFFDIRQALLRIRPERTYLEEIELFDLKRSLQTIQSLVSFFKGNQASDGRGKLSYPTLAKEAECVETFPQIIKRIDEVLNKFGRIKDTATPALVQIRHQVEIVTRGISHNLRQIIQDAQKNGLIERDVTPTMRDGRLVIPVAPALKRKIKGIVHDESATGKTVFIEPSPVVEANNRIRELKGEERREIMRILQELTAMIRPLAGNMIQSLQFLAQIDFLRALTGLSRTFGCVVPHLVDQPYIDWTQAIHPILQQTLLRHGTKQVPLDVSLKGTARILLISGPNAGGKSVCLKTIGLLQYMMQCGIPVPMNENSTMGIFKDIFLSIGDEQSIENELSTYSSHLLSLKTMMKKAGSESLLLIDEFGGGTEPQIGGALAEGILDKFVSESQLWCYYNSLSKFEAVCR